MNKPLTLTVHSTHFYLIDCAGGKLLIDAGWELAAFRAQMKAYQLSWEQIRWIMFTHHHPDHAGLVQAVRELSGARLILHEKQIPYLEDAARVYGAKERAVPANPRGAGRPDQPGPRGAGGHRRAG
jgi:glyoxylase-like metal-dependent hydrolase (beta-lactamase superfamily II)